MSGELINTERAIHSSDLFSLGIGGFSSKSINDLFDVNDDGEVSGMERDRMQSASVLNTLESINPVVARAYNDSEFQIDRGMFLTKKQRASRDKTYKIVLEQIAEFEKSKVPERRYDVQPLNIEEKELDTKTLSDDLVERQYLEQAELDNPV